MIQESSSPSTSSPFSGCSILLVGLLLVVVSLGFSLFALLQQYREIAKFTGEKPELTEISSLENQDTSLNSLAERLEVFRQQLTRKPGKSADQIALSADDINLAIAAYKPLQNLRGAFRILSMEGETMRIAASFPLNGKPRLTRNTEEKAKGLISSDPRFLNGILIARPYLLHREIALEIDEILVPNGASVPKERIEQISPYRITERYLKDETLEALLGKLTHVGISNGKFILARVPGEKTPDKIAIKKYDAARSRLFLLFGLGAGVILLIVSLIFLLAPQKKALEKADENEFREE